MAADHRKVAFIVAGVQKGGTTALFDYLGEEPALSLAREKEVHFFDDEDQDWAAPDYGAYHAHFAAPDGRQRGEATPIYLYWPGSLERIAAYNPGDQADRHAARPGGAGLVALEDGIRPRRGDRALRLVHPRRPPAAVRGRTLGLRPRGLLCGARLLWRAVGAAPPPVPARSAADPEVWRPARRSRRGAQPGAGFPGPAARRRAGAPRGPCRPRDGLWRRADPRRHRPPAGRLRPRRRAAGGPDRRPVRPEATVSSRPPGEGPASLSPTEVSPCAWRSSPLALPSPPPSVEPVSPSPSHPRPSSYSRSPARSAAAARSSTTSTAIRVRACLDYRCGHRTEHEHDGVDIRSWTWPPSGPAWTCWPPRPGG